MSKSPFDTLMEVSMGFTLARTLHVIAPLGAADALEHAVLRSESGNNTTRTTREVQ